MSGQYFHRTLVALAEVRRGVLERLPDGAGGTGGDRPVLPVLQLRAAASEPSVSDAGRSLPGRKAREGIDRYFQFYNYERPHQSLAYRTPADLYRGGSVRPCHEDQFRSEEHTSE